MRAAFVVADVVRETSPAAIGELRDLGLSVVLLTGDNRATAHAVGVQLGLDPEADVIAEVMPADKLAVIERLQADGHVVAMVGDGVNDAAALAQADIGIAMGTGADVAIEASDITVVRPDLAAVADSIRLSQRTLGTIKANLFWAFAYNTVAIPFAASGLAQPDDRGRRYGLVEPVRRVEQPAPVPLHTPSPSSDPYSSSGRSHTIDGRRGGSLKPNRTGGSMRRRERPEIDAVDARRTRVAPSGTSRRDTTPAHRAGSCRKCARPWSDERAGPGSNG